MDWINKRVRLKPGVDPTDNHIGKVVSQLNPYQVKVHWGGGTYSDEYIYVLEALPLTGKGDVVYDMQGKPVGIVILVHGDNVVIGVSAGELKVINISEIRLHP